MGSRSLWCGRWSSRSETHPPLRTISRFREHRCHAPRLLQLAASLVGHDAGMVRVELTCADGTPFPVEFDSDEDTQAMWQLEREHSVGPQPPMAVALSRLGVPGGERAYAESGLPFPSSWQRTPNALGFSYFRSGMPDPEEMAAFFSGCAVLVERYGSALGIWRDYSLPRVREALAVIDGDSEGPLSVLAEQQEYAFHHTMIPAYVTWNDMRQVADVCAPIYG